MTARASEPEPLPLPPSAPTFPLARAGAAAAVTAGAALAVAACVLVRLHQADVPLFLAVNGWRGVPPLAWELLSVSGLGLSVILVGAILTARQPRAFAALPWGFAVAGALAHAVKMTWHLPRPAGLLGLEHVHVLGPVLFRNGMPSGHALSATALVAVLWLEGGAAWRRPGAMAAAVALVGAVGLSRVATGAHFPADVVAGVALGAVAGWLGVDLARLTRTAAWLERAPGRWVVALVLGGTSLAMIAVDTGHPRAASLQLALGAVGLAAAAREVLALRAAVAARAGLGARGAARC